MHYYTDPQTSDSFGSTCRVYAATIVKQLPQGSSASYILGEAMGTACETHSSDSLLGLVILFLAPWDL